jgi:hypothetical protein
MIGRKNSRYTSVAVNYAQKWKIAMSRFNGYYANIPSFLKAEHIEDYHSYVAALEEASGEDLSHFKIPPDRLKPKLVSVRPGGYGGGPGSAQYSKEKYCDSRYFQSQIDGLKNYLSTVGPRPSGPNYEELNDFALLGEILDPSGPFQKNKGAAGSQQPLVN